MKDVLMGLVWPVAIAVICVFAITLIGRPLRRVLKVMANKHATLEAESAARLEGLRIGLRERGLELRIREGSLKEETALHRAELLRGTAQANVDAKAAARSLRAAIRARSRALLARGKAEAALALDHLRARHEAELAGAIDWNTIFRAYEAYCSSREEDPATIGQWYAGLPLAMPPTAKDQRS